jgi:hypothetical protein
MQCSSLRQTAATVVMGFITLTAVSTFAGTDAKIEQLRSWGTCSACAGAGGTGRPVNHWLAYGIASPSLDGAATQFTINGGFPFADATWWNQLGGKAVSHFTYDLNFFIKDTGSAEALEFDVNQSVDGRKFIFGTQCGVNYDHQWDVWDPAGHTWRQTGIPCTVQANTWNHLTWQLYRAGGYVNYYSVTLNGVTSYVGRAYSSIPSGAYELNVAFQMDQTRGHVPYSVWLNGVTLYSW